MKKAFTLLELVFVIVIIAIIASIAIPDSRSTKLREAAIQLVSHIRYTQHLAMVDDKFEMTDNSWFKKRWQIIFQRSANFTQGMFSYTIFSDDFFNLTAPDGLPTFTNNEIALDPIDSSKFLSGGTHSLNSNDNRANIKMNLGLSYGVTNITFTGDCTNQNFAFDHFGRPFNAGLNNDTQSYMNGDLIQRSAANSVCDITLTDGTDNVIIRIEPETGYTRII